MPVEICGLLEDVESYTGKNGFGANLTISKKVGKKTKRLSFTIKDEAQYTQLEKLLDTDVILIVALEQNNFGLRFGEIYEIKA
jgi:hypothetical protein